MGSVKIEAEPLALHQRGHLTANRIEEFHAHLGMLLDLLNKHLHVSSGGTVTGNSGVDLFAERLQKSLLISVERLGTGMGDVHRRNRGNQSDIAESSSKSSKVSDVESISPTLSWLS